MKCPNDDSTLTMSERSGIEIDYCPECRGVWLDRGELDKIIDRADPGPAAPPPAQSRPEPRYAEQRYSDQGGHYRRKKKDNWLSELFD